MQSVIAHNRRNEMMKTYLTEIPSSPTPRAEKWLVAALACLTLLMPMRSSIAEPNETLGPGDSIRVTVFQNPDLTTETRVSSQGTIKLPLIGDVKVSGMSPGDAVNSIANKLKDENFVRDPQVSISVIQVRSRQVTVLGQVARPGRYALDDTSSKLTDILALAGGISPGGCDIVTLMKVRNGKTEKQEIDVSKMDSTVEQSPNVDVENGDTIFVQRAPMFYIYGEVQHAGSYRLESRMNVMQALSIGGGLTLRGTERGIKIHRNSGDGTLTKIDAKMGDQIHANDIIYVDESFF